MEPFDGSILRDQDDAVAEGVGGASDPDPNSVAENRPVAGLSAEQPVQEVTLALTLEASEPEDLASVHGELPGLLSAPQANIPQLERRLVPRPGSPWRGRRRGRLSPPSG